MNTIISVEEAKKLGRPIGKVSQEKILAFILEVEQTIIKKAIGDEIFSKLKDGETFDEPFHTLLEGGSFVDKCGRVRIITGLKTAIAYYVYAQNVRAGDFESTRYGMVIKDNEYSNPISSKERDMIANSATTVADSYLKECLEYCAIAGIDTGNGSGNAHITSGCIIRKIKI